MKGDDKAPEYVFCANAPLVNPILWKIPESIPSISPVDFDPETSDVVRLPDEYKIPCVWLSRRRSAALCTTTHHN